MIGAIVGSYRIVDTVSSGGMGIVYRAEHTLIGKVAAVKVLHPELSSNRDIVNRFFNEAKATTSIKHPGIVEVFDFGYMASGHAYLIMEFLDGMPLSLRKRGVTPEAEAALLLRGVCLALAAAHDKGVIHRDLKPDNIFVVPDPESAHGERTKILDFGIAKLTDAGAGIAGGTRTGVVMGTPAYMSPEQCRGAGEVDHRSDVYSIGCMLYELVTGRPPFTHAGAGELIAAHLFMTPDLPSRLAAVSPETDALIMALLAKRPEDRVQNMAELAHQLALIAQYHGHVIPGDARRGAHNEVTVMRPDPRSYPSHPGVRSPTPVFASGMLPPSMSSQSSMSGQPPGTAILGKPTTLSGAAAQAGQQGRAGRAGRTAGIAIASALIAGAGVFAVLARGGSMGPAAAPAAATSPTAAPAATAAGSPSPAAPQPAAPAPAIAPPAAPAPTTAPPEVSTTAPPAAPTTAAVPAPTTALPATVPASAAAAPGDPAAKPAVAKPAVHHSAKPAAAGDAKPRHPHAGNPDGAGSGSQKHDMLESDI